MSEIDSFQCLLKISIDNYYGSNVLINKLIAFLSQEKTGIIFSFVHGSIATNEQIKYSDFDGLLIVKDDVFEDKKLRRKFNKFLRETLKLIYEFDPLQHHGWFIIKESELKNYPQTYFPHELFQYSKVIYPSKPVELEINIPENIDYKTPFIKLSESILRKLEADRKPKNIYQLKGLLSQFMLLPALYIQSKENKGIFKKFSFDEAKKDFSSDEWEIIDKVSEIRENWNYEINFLQKKLLSITNKRFRKFAVTYFAPDIPAKIKSALTENFYDEMSRLVLSMQSKIF